MRVSTRFTVIILLIAMGMTALSLGTMVPARAQVEEQRYLLITSSGLPPALDALVASVGGRLVESLDEIGVAIVASSEPGFEIAASTLPSVQSVAPDVSQVMDLPVTSEDTVADDSVEEGVQADATPIGTPNINKLQWNMQVIHVQEAWLAMLTAFGPGANGHGVRVAILDSGIDGQHIAFKNRIDTARSTSFVDEVLSGSADATVDLAGHGTHVAGIIGSNGSFPGVAPDVTLISVKVLKKVLKPNGALAAEGKDTDVIRGIYYAVKEAKADVINASLGFTFAKNDRSFPVHIDALNRVINFANQNGVVVVASIGNDMIDLDKNRNMVKAPAEITHVMAISGTGPLSGLNPDPDTFGTYNNYGSSVFVAAPGGNVWRDANGKILNPPTDGIISACSSRGPVAACKGRTNLYTAMAGSSMAAAHVAGLVALMRAKFGPISPAQVRAIVRQTSDDLGKPGNDSQFGTGRINAYRAVTGK